VTQAVAVQTANYLCQPLSDNVARRTRHCGRPELANVKAFAHNRKRATLPLRGWHQGHLHTRSRLGTEVRYGTDLASFEQEDSGVTAILRDLDSGRIQTVRTNYLVGADGVHSRIRKALGVSTSGHGALPIFMVFIYFRAPWPK
jgi:flavin-dependent dehydrogenase